MRGGRLQTQAITRREAVRLLGSASAGAWFAGTQIGLNSSLAPNTFAAVFEDDPTPPLAPGAPTEDVRVVGETTNYAHTIELAGRMSEF
jgi:hypothetical protein